MPRRSVPCASVTLPSSVFAPSRFSAAPPVLIRLPVPDTVPVSARSRVPSTVSAPVSATSLFTPTPGTRLSMLVPSAVFSVPLPSAWALPITTPPAFSAKSFSISLRPLSTSVPLPALLRPPWPEIAPPSVMVEPASRVRSPASCRLLPRLTDCWLASAVPLEAVSAPVPSALSLCATMRPALSVVPPLYWLLPVSTSVPALVLLSVPSPAMFTPIRAVTSASTRTSALPPSALTRFNWPAPPLTSW